VAFSLPPEAGHGRGLDLAILFDFTNAPLLEVPGTDRMPPCVSGLLTDLVFALRAGELGSTGPEPGAPKGEHEAQEQQGPKAQHAINH
jgi:hypothetical protein